MVLGEDKNKVHNIVCANLDGLKKLYSPYLPLVVDFPFDDENCMIKVCICICELVVLHMYILNFFT